MERLWLSLVAILASDKQTLDVLEGMSMVYKLNLAVDSDLKATATKITQHKTLILNTDKALFKAA